MRFREYAILFLLGCAMAVLVGSLQTTPGYMDADYYYANALLLAQGEFQEPFLWNYLNDPAGLPQPAFGYWMPLISLLAAAGLKVSHSFWGARLLFILLAGLAPPLTALLAYCLTRQTWVSRLAGALALFPGFYTAYLATTDAFTLYMVLGGLFALLAFEPVMIRGRVLPEPVRFFLLGGVAGLMHLARADGLIWLAAALGAGVVHLMSGREGERRNLALSPALKLLMGVLLGYGLVMAPWYLRNVQVWGWLFPPSGSRTLWMTQYEEIMIFPAGQLNFQHWLAAGWVAHLQAWLEALSGNLQTLAGVQGCAALLPFMLTGIWHLRRCTAVRFMVGMWLLTLAIMTVVFPFAGLNGGFFHSGAAFQPFLWAVAAMGVLSAVQWAARWRHWERGQQVALFLAVLLVAVEMLLSAGMYFQRVVGTEPGPWLWNRSDAHYREVEQALVRFGAEPEQRVLVNNPPGYYLVSGREGAVVPFGGEETLLAVAQKYELDYLILEINNPWMLQDLYLLKSNNPALNFLGSVGETHIYRIDRAVGAH